MKKVAHRIDKDCAGLLPAQRYFKGMLVKRHPKTIDIIRTARGLQTVSHAFGVAVLAACTDFGASGNRIPSGFSPFDFGFLSHTVSHMKSIAY